jgi:hypothetical protein
MKSTGNNSELTLVRISYLNTHKRNVLQERKCTELHKINIDVVVNINLPGVSGTQFQDEMYCYELLQEAVTIT